MNPSLETAAQEFKQASEQFLREAKFRPIASEQLATVQRKIPLSRELLDWYQTAAPTDFYIPLPGNNLYFPEPTTLDRYQRGYRWSGADEHTIDPLWNANWIVIADVGGDAVIAHIDQPDTPISFALHGAGVWEPRSIAPSLAVYLNVLTAWIKLVDGDYRLRSFINEGGELNPHALDEIREFLSNHLDEDQQANFLWALWAG